MPVRLNHVWNIFCFAIYFCVMAGLLFFAASLLDPMVGGLVMIGAGLWALLGVYRNTQLANMNLRRYADSHEYSPNLRLIVDRLCAAAGKDPADVPLYDFDMNRTAQLNAKQKRSMAGYILRAQTHNAAARSDMLLVSTPLLKLLDDEEEKAIFAHEMAHVVYRHSFFSVMFWVMAQMISWLLTVYFWVTIASFGWNYVVLAFTVGFVAVMLGKKYLPDWLYQTGIARFVSLYGFLFWVSPVFLKVCAIMIAMRRLPPICSALYSQACEYMADRGAVDLGAKPLALALALRKITFLQRRAQQKFSKRKIDFSGDGLMNAYFALYASHPPVERRVERLCRIASYEHAIPWAEMQKVRRGEIDLPADHDIPDDVVKGYMNI